MDIAGTGRERTCTCTHTHCNADPLLTHTARRAGLVCGRGLVARWRFGPGSATARCPVHTLHTLHTVQTLHTVHTVHKGALRHLVDNGHERRGASLLPLDAELDDHIVEALRPFPILPHLLTRHLHRTGDDILRPGWVVRAGWSGEGAVRVVVVRVAGVGGGRRGRRGSAGEAVSKARRQQSKSAPQARGQWHPPKRRPAAPSACSRSQVRSRVSRPRWQGSPHCRRSPCRTIPRSPTPWSACPS